MGSKLDSFIPYAPLPSSEPVVVLTSYYRRRHPPSCLRSLRCFILYTAAILLLCAAVYFLYPYDPDINLVRIHLNRVRVIDRPKLALNLSFSTTVKVLNRNFFSLDYDSIRVSIGYRGRELGFVRSSGGLVRARGNSYVDATLDLDGLEIVNDVFHLIQDLAKGVIPFDTVAWVKGELGLVFFEIPIQGKVSCEVYVNTNNQTIVRQDCHPV